MASNAAAPSEVVRAAGALENSASRRRVPASRNGAPCTRSAAAMAWSSTVAGAAATADAHAAVAPLVEAASDSTCTNARRCGCCSAGSVATRALAAYGRAAMKRSPVGANCTNTPFNAGTHASGQAGAVSAAIHAVATAWRRRAASPGSCDAHIAAVATATTTASWLALGVPPFKNGASTAAASPAMRTASAGTNPPTAAPNTAMSLAAPAPARASSIASACTSSAARWALATAVSSASRRWRAVPWSRRR